MRRILALLPMLALAASCSSESDNAVNPPPADPRGTAVGPDHVFVHASPLAWSAVTNEVLGFSSPTPAAGTGLLALRITDGVARVFDPVTPQSLALSGSGVYAYSVADLPPSAGDAVVLRRRRIDNGAVDSLGGAPDGTPITFVLSLDGQWLAWGSAGADPLEPGPLVLRDLATGDTLDVGTGSPVALAPDGSALVYRPDPGSPALRRWVRATRSDQPFDPGLPAGAGPAAWHWDGLGLRALYIVPPRRVDLLNHDPGTVLTVFQSPVDLDVQPPAWSPEGSHAAVWGRRLAGTGNYTDHLLYVIDLAARVGTQVASGTELPGAVTFSADAARVAYLYGERLFTTSAAATIGPDLASDPTRPARGAVAGRAR